MCSVSAAGPPASWYCIGFLPETVYDYDGDDE